MTKKKSKDKDKKKHRPRKKQAFDKFKPNFRVVKTSIKSILRDEEFVKELRETVLRANKIRDDCLLFISTYVLYRYSEDQSIYEIDDQFVEYSIKVMGVFDKPRPPRTETNQAFLNHLQEFYNKVFEPIYNHQTNRLGNMKYVNNYMITDIVTSINTNLKEHYTTRLNKCIRIFGGKIFDKENDNPELEKKDILYKLSTDILDMKFEEIDPMFVSWFSDVCKLEILPNGIGQVENLRLDPHKEPSKYIIPTIGINQQFEIFNKVVEEKLANIKEDKFYVEYLKLQKEHKELKNKKGTKKELRTIWKQMKVVGDQSETIKLNRQKIKLFSCLPLPSFGVKYVMFDTASLRELFTNIANGKVDDIRQDVWGSLFKMENRNLRNNKHYDFFHMISTDGVGCSLVFKLNNSKHNKFGKRVKDEKQELLYITDLLKSQIESYDNFVPNDPGVQEPINMMDSQGNRFRYTRAQRRFETKSKLHAQILEKAKKKTPEVLAAEEELSKCCKKTTDFKTFCKYLQVRHKHYEVLSEFYQRPLWQKLKWYRYINTQKSEAKVRKNLKETFGENTLYVLGDGGAAARNLHCGPPTICLRVRKIVGGKDFHSVMIDEFRTSKLCHKCHGVLDKVSIKEEPVYRLLSCSNPDCNKFTPAQRKAKDKLVKFDKKYKKEDGPIFFNRDVNACENMLNIVDYMLAHELVKDEYQVPKNFRRATKNVVPAMKTEEQKRCKSSISLSGRQRH